MPGSAVCVCHKVMLLGGIIKEEIMFHGCDKLHMCVGWRYGFM